MVRVVLIEGSRVDLHPNHIFGFFPLFFLSSFLYLLPPPSLTISLLFFFLFPLLLRQPYLFRFFPFFPLRLPLFVTYSSDGKIKTIPLLLCFFFHFCILSSFLSLLPTPPLVQVRIQKYGSSDPKIHVSKYELYRLYSDI